LRTHALEPASPQARPVLFYDAAMLYTILIILAIIALVLFILGRR
jgi:hypothetical protein